MSILKSALTTALVIGSVLVQNSTMAYPKAPRDLELNFLKAYVKNFYGTVTPEVASYLEEQYNLKSPSIELMLSGGYIICDSIQQANYQGLDSQAFIEQQISSISTTANQILEPQGTSLTEEQIITIYNTANSYLCPELK